MVKKINTCQIIIDRTYNRTQNVVQSRGVRPTLDFISGGRKIFVKWTRVYSMWVTSRIIVVEIQVWHYIWELNVPTCLLLLICPNWPKIESFLSWVWMCKYWLNYQDPRAVRVWLADFNETQKRPKVVENSWNGTKLIFLLKN